MSDKPISPIGRTVREAREERYANDPEFARVWDAQQQLIEELAAIEHQRWADWQGYFHSKLTRLDNGDLVIPAGYVAALQQLIVTPYAELSEEQKNNDRREVRRYLHLVQSQAS